MKYDNLKIIGTSHIAKQSIDDITSEFEKNNPDIIALELDNKRLMSLLSKKKKEKIPLSYIKKIGLQGFIFSILGQWIEKKLGDSVGVIPGSDMLTAFKLAKKDKKIVALVDQDIEITLKRFSKEITLKEKLRFLIDLFKGLVLKKKDIEVFDLRTVPNEEMTSIMMKKVKKRYPNAYKVLVTERNNILARNLMILMKKNPDKKIMAIVGAGHEKEMISIIKKKINSIEII
jgi:pheromone shutdown-related protein TraB